MTDKKEDPLEGDGNSSTPARRFPDQIRDDRLEHLRAISDASDKVSKKGGDRAGKSSKRARRLSRLRGDDGNIVRFKHRVRGHQR